MKKTELIVALDVPNAAAIPAIVDSLPSAVTWYKVGLELFIAAGPNALIPLQKRGKMIFLDLKLHDIPRTVERAIDAAPDGVGLMTLHAGGGRRMIEAAASAAQRHKTPRPRLLAVTALTSLDVADLLEIGIQDTPAAYAERLAHVAINAGADGLVCSVLEAAALRRRIGPEALLVTPGIRPAGSDAGDQRRIATPADAVAAGANFIVVGRPILDAPNPAAAAAAILSDLA